MTPAELKEKVSAILYAAVSGTDKKYRYDGYMRWGLVEKDIHAAIDEASGDHNANAVEQRTCANCDNGSMTVRCWLNPDDEPRQAPNSTCANFKPKGGAG